MQGPIMTGKRLGRRAIASVLLLGSASIAILTGCQSRPPVEDLSESQTVPLPYEDAAAGPGPVKSPPPVNVVVEAPEPPAPLALAEMCPTEWMTRFDNWPRPSATHIYPMHPAILFGHPTRRPSNLREAGDHFFAIADAAGLLGDQDFKNYTYLGVGCRGFAFIPLLETIDEKAERIGFEGAEKRESWFSFQNFANIFLGAPTGHYRQYVFVLTDTPWERGSVEQISEGEFKKALLNPRRALPPAFEKIAYSDGEYRAYILIYEFRKDPDQASGHLTPPDGRWSRSEHFRGAKLSFSSGAE